MEHAVSFLKNSGTSEETPAEKPSQMMQLFTDVFDPMNTVVIHKKEAHHIPSIRFI